MKHTNVLCGQNVRLLNVTAGGADSYQLGSKKLHMHSTQEAKRILLCMHNIFRS